MILKAGILVYDNFNKKILTISNQLDQNIGLPKGQIEPNENVYDCAFRELYEETGLLFSQRPKIQYEFKIRKKIRIFVINLPSGSEYNFLPNDEIKNKECIYYVKWRKLDELVSNINFLNYTIKVGKNKHISENIKKLFTDEKFI